MAQAKKDTRRIRGQVVERKPILIVLDLIENITITSRLISLPLSDHDYHYYHYHHWRCGYELNH